MSTVLNESITGNQQQCLPECGSELTSNAKMFREVSLCNKCFHDVSEHVMRKQMYIIVKFKIL